MSGRGLSTAQQNAAEGANSISLALVELHFDSGVLRLALAPWNVEVGADVYIATGILASIDALDESTDSTEGISFKLGGLDTGIIDLVATEPYRGRLFKLFELWVDQDHEPIETPRLEWLGRMTAFGTTEANGAVLVNGQAEHYEAELKRPRVLRYNDADQQRLFPGDKGFDMTEQLADARVIVWPSKEALRR